MDFQAIKYFKSLNSLRFFAAAFVLIGHSEALRFQKGINSNLHDWSFFNNGQNAVLFFFVLSGFLITYLLLKELKEKQKVAIKKFYIKRVRRIWPLYFLLVFIGCIVQPWLIDYLNIPYKMPYTFGETWYYFVFFVPGLVTLFYGSHLLEPLWSIGVEEVFYLIWAPLVQLFRKHLLQLLIAVIGIKLILLFLLQFLPKQSFPPVTSHLIHTMKFEAMAIGGLGAYLLFYFGKRLTKHFFFKPFSQVLILSLIAIYLGAHLTINDKLPIEKQFFATSIKSVFFLYLMLAISVIPHKIVSLENRAFNYLGEISYGIYMFHLLVATLVLDFMGKIETASPFLNGLLFYFLIFGFTILLSAFSKRYFERIFMKKA